MRRAVLDPGVYVSALISPNGAPAQLVQEATRGEFELIVSPLLIDELHEVLSREKFRRYVSLDAVRGYVDYLQRVATTTLAPKDPSPFRSPDPDDDYLISLAKSEGADIVSGDSHLLDLSDRAPIHRPNEYLGLLETQ